MAASGRKLLSDFVFESCKDQRMTKTLAKNVVNGLLDTIVQNTKSSGATTFTRFGTFKTVERGARQMRNPQNGAQINVPRKTYLKFHASKTVNKNL